MERFFSNNRSVGLSRFYKTVTNIALIGLAFLLPLFFLPITTDSLEVNKQALLVLATVVAALCSLGFAVHQKSVTFRGGWVNVLPIFFFLTILASAIFSSAGFVSWVGQSSQQYTSVLTTAAFVLLFFLVINATSENLSRRLMLALIGSSSLVGLHLLLLSFTGRASFNTVGTANGAAVLLIIATLLANALWLDARKKQPFLQALTVLLSLVTIVILTALDFWVLWVILLVGLAVLMGFALVKTDVFSESSRFVLPMFLLVVSLLLLFLRSPLHLQLPIEVAPSQQGSWSIAKQTLSDHSVLVGSGPGTFSFDYARYRASEINTGKFWTFRFDRGASYYLTLLPTVGILGLGTFILLVLAVGTKALGQLVSKSTGTEDWHQTYTLLCAWAALVVGFGLYGSNLTLQFCFWLLTALLARQTMPKMKAIQFNRSPRVGLGMSFLFVLVAVGLVTGMFITAQGYLAETAFAKAVKNDRAGGDLNTTVQSLARATSFNRLSDVYYRNLAQALLLQVRDQLKEGKTIPAEKTTIVQQLIATSIAAAKQTTALEPNNVANWEVSGAIYREVSPVVGGADQFAITAFEKAHTLEPANPTHLVNLGRSYLVFAENLRMRAAADKKDMDQATKDTVSADLKKAEEALNQAIELKTDYAPAHYYLALVYERQGRLADAITKMQAVKTYNPLDVGVAFQLGVLNLRQGNYDAAQTEFERAIVLQPNYADAHWFLAAIYEQKGKIDLAIEQVQKVLELNPDNELVKAKLDRLKSGQTSTEIPEPVEEGDSSATKVDDTQPKQ